MSPLDLNAWLVFLLVALASARTFRLLAFDTITQPVRDVLEVYVFVRYPLLKEGFECGWCSGYWYAVGWALTAFAWSDTWLWQLAAIGFAANYIAANLNALYDVTHETAEDLLNES